MQQASAEKYVAKYSYSATQTDELDLVKGVVIDVISKEADGWWQGKNQEGKIGWFPSNYVEVSHEPNDLTGGGVVSRHGNGNSDARPVLEVVRALYPFKSDNSEELSFETGDLFDIIGKPPSDPEWYEGRSAEGRVGLIPRNYIETVPGAALAQPEASNYDDVTPDMIIGNNAHVEPVRSIYPCHFSFILIICCILWSLTEQDSHRFIISAWGVSFRLKATGVEMIPC